MPFASHLSSATELAMKKSAILFLFVCYLCACTHCAKKKKKKGLKDGDFCYNQPHCGPSFWPEPCISGTRQSPINFDGEKMAIKILPPTYRQFYKFTTTPETNSFLIRNTGQSIQVSFPQGKDPILKGYTVGLPGTYRFSRMNFHWGRFHRDGSEHRISGKGFAMELQIVHYSTHYSSYEQASASVTDPYAISIISILYEIGPLDNLGLKPIIDSIPLIRNYNNGVDVSVSQFLNLRALLPAFLSFYRYEGSETTPGCLENRVWSVFKKPNRMSKKQLEALRSIFTKGNVHLMIDNHRGIQKRHDRAVTLYFTPSNMYDWLMQFAIYVYTFGRQLMAVPGDVLQKQIKQLLKPFIGQVNLQNGLLGFKEFS